MQPLSFAIVQELSVIWKREVEIASDFYDHNSDLTFDLNYPISRFATAEPTMFRCISDVPS